MRVVIDTNVLVSGLLNPNGTPAAVIDLLLNDRLLFLYDIRIIQEYIAVLHRKKFDFDADLVDSFIDFLETTGELIAAEPSSRAFQDDDDRKFFEVAIGGGAEYLITGNIKHFPNVNIVVSPRIFMNEYLKTTKM